MIEGGVAIRVAAPSLFTPYFPTYKMYPLLGYKIATRRTAAYPPMGVVLR